MALLLLRADLSDGRGRRDHPADPVWPVDHRMEAGYRRRPAADACPMGCRVRTYKQIPEYRAIHYGMSLAEFKDDLFLGIRASVVGPADRRRFAAPLSDFGCAATPAAARPGARAASWAWVCAGPARLVHGRERPRSTGSRSASTASSLIWRWRSRSTSLWIASILVDGLCAFNPREALGGGWVPAAKPRSPWDPPPLPAL